MLIHDRTSVSLKLVKFSTSPRESVIFYWEGRAPENWGDQVLFLRSKGGIKRFFQIKKGGSLIFLKK